MQTAERAIDRPDVQISPYLYEWLEAYPEELGDVLCDPAVRRQILTAIDDATEIGRIIRRALAAAHHAAFIG